MTRNYTDTYSQWGFQANKHDWWAPHCIIQYQSSGILRFQSGLREDHITCRYNHSIYDDPCMVYLPTCGSFMG